MGTKFFYSPKTSTQSLTPSQFLTAWEWGLLPRGKLAGAWGWPLFSI